MGFLISVIGWLLMVVGFFQVNAFLGIGFIFLPIGFAMVMDRDVKQDYRNHLVWHQELKDEIYAHKN